MPKPRENGGLPLLTPKQAAVLLAVQPSCLEVWRRLGSQSLPFYRIGRSVRYSAEDIAEFVATCRQSGQRTPTVAR